MVKKHEVPWELIHLLMQEIDYIKGNYKIRRVKKQFTDEDFLFSNEFNKYSVDENMVMITKHKQYYSGRQRKIKAINTTFSEVSDLAQRAANDIRLGLLKHQEITSLTKYKNNLENSMRKASNLMPGYFRFTGKKEATPNYEKAMLCVTSSLKAIKKEIKTKKRKSA